MKKKSKTARKKKYPTRLVAVTNKQYSSILMNKQRWSLNERTI